MLTNIQIQVLWCFVVSLIAFYVFEIDDDIDIYSSEQQQQPSQAIGIVAARDIYDEIY